jgi:hypothetical protein
MDGDQLQFIEVKPVAEELVFGEMELKPTQLIQNITDFMSNTITETGVVLNMSLAVRIWLTISILGACLSLYLFINVVQRERVLEKRKKGK